MESRIEFDINESLKYYLSDPTSVPTPEADSELLDCEADPEQLSTTLIDNTLNPIVDAVAENPEGLARPAFFDSLQFLLKCALDPSHSSEPPGFNGPDSELLNSYRYTPALQTRSLSKLLDLVVSGLSVQADVIHGDLEADEQDGIQHHKQLLEMYGFLLQWALSSVEVKAAEKPADAAPARRGAGKSTKSKGTTKDNNWDWSPQIQISMETMCKVMKLKLGRVFLTTSDRDTFINLFTRTIYLILESEQRVKSMTIRMHAFKVLCIAVKHHGHAFGKSFGCLLTVDRPADHLTGAQTSIVQNLTYFEHLSEPMAEFLHILAEQYDYPQLSDEILKYADLTECVAANPFAEKLETRNSIRMTPGGQSRFLHSL